MTQCFCKIHFSVLPANVPTLFQEYKVCEYGFTEYEWKKIAFFEWHYGNAFPDIGNMQTEELVKTKREYFNSFHNAEKHGKKGTRQPRERMIDKALEIQTKYGCTLGKITSMFQIWGTMNVLLISEPASKHMTLCFIQDIL